MPRRDPDAARQCRDHSHHRSEPSGVAAAGELRGRYSLEIVGADPAARNVRGRRPNCATSGGASASASSSQGSRAASHPGACTPDRTGPRPFGRGKTPSEWKSTIRLATAWTRPGAGPPSVQSASSRLLATPTSTAATIGALVATAMTNSAMTIMSTSKSCPGGLAALPATHPVGIVMTLGRPARYHHEGNPQDQPQFAAPSRCQQRVPRATLS